MATYNINLNLSTAAAQAQLSALQTAAGKPITAKVNFSQPLGRITGDLAMFDKSMAAASARVAAFGAVSGAIYLVSKAMSEAAKSMMLVDKELTELNTFLGESQGKLRAFGDSLFSIAKNTATSFNAVAEAAKEFARQGLSMEDTLKRTNDALILSRISGLGAAESVTALTTAINSFNKSGLTSSEIINKLVQVDSQFAVSSSDLAQALSRVGSSAQDSGVSIDQLVAAVTTAQQTTGRGGAVIGNALKTIFTRMKRPEVIDQLREIGVAVKDQNGFFLDGISILKNYTDVTKNLSQTEKAKTAELLGGIYQINVLNSLINDLSKSNGVYARALQASNSATDQAFDKNEALNQSLSATIEITKANLQQKGSAIATPLLTPLVKTGAAIINKTLNIFDKKEGDEEGAKSGRSFGESLLKGLGAAIAGPGVVVVGALAFAIGRKLLTFGVDAAKSLLGITSASQNILNLQTLITSTLNNQPRIMQQVLSGQMSQTTAAQALLAIMQQQTVQLQTNATLSSTLANTLAKGGFAVNPVTGLKRKAMGHIPEADQYAERAGALSGGYSPGAVVKTPSSIGGIMNTSEKVKYVPGFSQPFINPPETSKAGRMHRENAIKQTGINPYSSRGFIPNFIANHESIIYQTYEPVDGATKGEEDVLEKVNNNWAQGKFKSALRTRLGQEQVGLNHFTRNLTSSDQKIVTGLFPPNFPAYDFYVKTKHGSIYELFLGQVKLQNESIKVREVIGKFGKGRASVESLRPDLLKSPKVKDEDVRNVILTNLRATPSETVQKNLTSKSTTPKKPLGLKKSLGFIPNFAYLDEVKQLESEAGNGTAIFDTEPFPHVRNSSQPTFESAINDHGGLQNALSDSASMQKSAGLIKSKGFVANFSKTSDWWEKRMEVERISRQRQDSNKHGSLTGYQGMSTGPNLMSTMMMSSILGMGLSTAGGYANPENVGQIAAAQRYGPLAMLAGGVGMAARMPGTPLMKAGAMATTALAMTPAVVAGFAGANQLESDVKSDQFQKIKDRTADQFNKLTQNTAQLAQSIEDLSSAYSDPNVSPEIVIKLGKKQAELIRNLDKTNPAMAINIALARTSAEKQTILASSMESAIKEKVVNDASIKFLELSDKKRKPKAIKSLFSDLSSQADTSGLDVQNLKPENLGEFLDKAGIGGSRKLFKNVTRLISPFIDYVKTNDKIRDKEESVKNELINLRRPSSDIRLKNERNQILRVAQKSTREQYLGDLVSYSSNFGPEAAISARADVAISNRSQDERGRFDTMLTSKAEKIPALKRFLGQGPSEKLDSEIKKLIVETKDPVQKNILETLSADTKASLKELQLIKSTENYRKELDLKLLALQQKLVFGGGVAASLSFEGKMASDDASATAFMQHEMGNAFGSQNTADAGTVNFAKAIKEKYPGLDFGPGAFDKVTQIGGNLRARDMQESLLRDAARAERMGDLNFASILKRAAGDRAKLQDAGIQQLKALLGMKDTPDDVKKAIDASENANRAGVIGKKLDSSKLAEAEKAIGPTAEALTQQLATSTAALMQVYEDSLQASFKEGLTITEASITVLTQTPNSEEKKSKEPEKSFWNTFKDVVTGWMKPATTDQPSPQNPPPANLNAGFIPNFKNPLKDAIRRESESVPFNSIRVDQSNKLKKSSNPFGLAVTNTIDEPRGLASIGLANDGYIPNFALFGDEKAREARKAARRGKLYVYDNIYDKFRLGNVNGTVGEAEFTLKQLPKGSKVISSNLGGTPLIQTKAEQRRFKEMNIIKVDDPKISKFEELKLKGTIPKSKKIDPILHRLEKEGKLTPKNLLDEINKITKGEPTIVKTAYGPNNYMSKGVYGTEEPLTQKDARSIIGKYNRGTASGLFIQEKVARFFDEGRVHIAVDEKGNVKLIKGASWSKASQSALFSADTVKVYQDSGLPKRKAIKVAKAFAQAAEVAAVKAARDMVNNRNEEIRNGSTKSPIRNAILGVDVGASVSSDADNAGLSKARQFPSSHPNQQMKTVVYEFNPTDVKSSSGYFGGERTSSAFLKGVLGLPTRQLRTRAVKQPNPTALQPLTPAVTQPNPTALQPLTPAVTQPNPTALQPLTPAVTQPNPTALQPLTPAVTQPNPTARQPLTPAVTQPSPTAPSRDVGSHFVPNIPPVTPAGTPPAGGGAGGPPVTPAGTPPAGGGAGGPPVPPAGTPPAGGGAGGQDGQGSTTPGTPTPTPTPPSNPRYKPSTSAKIGLGALLMLEAADLKRIIKDESLTTKEKADQTKDSLKNFGLGVGLTALIDYGLFKARSLKTARGFGRVGSAAALGFGAIEQYDLYQEYQNNVNSIPIDLSAEDRQRMNAEYKAQYEHERNKAALWTAGFAIVPHIPYVGPIVSTAYSFYKTGDAIDQIFDTSSSAGDYWGKALASVQGQYTQPQLPSDLLLPEEDRMGNDQTHALNKKLKDKKYKNAIKSGKIKDPYFSPYAFPKPPGSSSQSIGYTFPKFTATNAPATLATSSPEKDPVLPPPTDPDLMPFGDLNSLSNMEPPMPPTFDETRSASLREPSSLRLKALEGKIARNDIPHTPFSAEEIEKLKIQSGWTLPGRPLFSVPKKEGGFTNTKTGYYAVDPLENYQTKKAQAETRKRLEEYNQEEKRKASKLGVGYTPKSLEDLQNEFVANKILEREFKERESLNAERDRQANVNLTSPENLPETLTRSPTREQKQKLAELDESYKADKITGTQYQESRSALIPKPSQPEPRQLSPYERAQLLQSDSSVNSQPATKPLPQLQFPTDFMSAPGVNAASPQEKTKKDASEIEEKKKLVAKQFSQDPFFEGRGSDLSAIAKIKYETLNQTQANMARLLQRNPSLTKATFAGKSDSQLFMDYLDKPEKERKKIDHYLENEDATDKRYTKLLGDIQVKTSDGRLRLEFIRGQTHNVNPYYKIPTALEGAEATEELERRRWLKNQENIASVSQLGKLLNGNSNGFIPNFSKKKTQDAAGYILNSRNPLRDSIRRESKSVPLSSIRVDQSNKLKKSSNPFGLAVTNTIDEPRGLASIGLADGYVPNFSLDPKDPGKTPLPALPDMSYEDILAQINKNVPDREMIAKSVFEMQSLGAKFNHPLTLFQDGWTLIGKGVESAAFKKGARVFKIPLSGYDFHPDIINMKVEASSAVNNMFKAADLPILGLPVTVGQVQGISGLLQSYGGKTLKQTFPRTMSDAVMHIINTKWNTLTDEQTTFGTGKNRIFIDPHANNFTVGNSLEMDLIAAELRAKGDSFNVPNELVERVIKNAGLSAIDVNGYKPRSSPLRFADYLTVIPKQTTWSQGQRKLPSSIKLGSSTPAPGEWVGDTKYNMLPRPPNRSRFLADMKGLGLSTPDKQSDFAKMKRIFATKTPSRYARAGNWAKPTAGVGAIGSAGLILDLFVDYQEMKEKVKTGEISQQQADSENIKHWVKTAAWLGGGALALGALAAFPVTAPAAAIIGGTLAAYGTARGFYRATRWVVDQFGDADQTSPPLATPSTKQPTAPPNTQKLLTLEQLKQSGEFPGLNLKQPQMGPLAETKGSDINSEFQKAIMEQLGLTPEQLKQSAQFPGLNLKQPQMGPEVPPQSTPLSEDVWKMHSGIRKGSTNSSYAAEGFTPAFAQEKPAVLSSIPNFRNPLRDSIRRESKSVPLSSIRVGQSNKLKKSSNPFGLAVTNTIDEPRGLASIGLADGFIPNFDKRTTKLPPPNPEGVLVDVFADPTDGLEASKRNGKLGGAENSGLSAEDLEALKQKWMYNGRSMTNFPAGTPQHIPLQQFISTSEGNNATVDMFGDKERIQFGYNSFKVPEQFSKNTLYIRAHGGGPLGNYAVGMDKQWLSKINVNPSKENLDKVDFNSKFINFPVIAEELKRQGVDVNQIHNVISSACNQGGGCTDQEIQKWFPGVTNIFKAREGWSLYTGSEHRTFGQSNQSDNIPNPLRNSFSFREKVIKSEEEMHPEETLANSVLENGNWRIKPYAPIGVTNPRPTPLVIPMRIKNAGFVPAFARKSWAAPAGKFNKDDEKAKPIPQRFDPSTGDIIEDKKRLVARQFSRYPFLGGRGSNLSGIANYKYSTLSETQAKITKFLQSAPYLAKTKLAGKSDSEFFMDYLNKSEEEREKIDSYLQSDEATKEFQKTGILKDKKGESSMSKFAKLFNDNSIVFGSASGGNTPNYAGGFAPIFMQEKRAVLSSPSYVGHRGAVPMRSKVYKNAVINSSEIEVPANEVYRRMFGPAGANMKPKNSSETHAILNPAQQQSLGFSAGFIPNFSAEQFTAAITEAMRNGMASFAGGMIPSISNSNTVNINDERSYQGNSDSMMDGVLDILQSKFPKEMGKMGPRIAKR